MYKQAWNPTLAALQSLNSMEIKTSAGPSSVLPVSEDATTSVTNSLSECTLEEIQAIHFPEISNNSDSPDMDLDAIRLYEYEDDFKIEDIGFNEQGKTNFIILTLC